MIGVALYQGYRGVTKDFLKDSKTEEMSAPVRHWVTRIGVVGHLARMIVFGLVGVFLIKAAVEYNPKRGYRVGRRPAEVRGANVRVGPARSRRGRPDRVRALLTQRRPLPQNLIRSKQLDGRKDYPASDTFPPWRSRQRVRLWLLSKARLDRAFARGPDRKVSLSSFPKGRGKNDEGPGRSGPSLISAVREPVRCCRRRAARLACSRGRLSARLGRSRRRWRASTRHCVRGGGGLRAR